jgi:hypothetical protein
MDGMDLTSRWYKATLGSLTWGRATHIVCKFSRHPSMTGVSTVSWSYIYRYIFPSISTQIILVVDLSQIIKKLLKMTIYKEE